MPKFRKAFARLQARANGCIAAREIATKANKKAAATDIDKAFKMPGSMKKH